MERFTTVVIGAGHAGLAASRFLGDRSIDHVVLERGEVANSWRRERWDSLRLLTPNWQSRLPGLRYEGLEPDGYMTMGEVTEFIEHFAKVSAAPVRTGVNVTSVRLADGGYRLTTSSGEIHARTVVIASGACNQPAVPALRDAVPPSVEQLTPFGYRHPAQLPDGGVLVVGASATGLQLAAEQLGEGETALEVGVSRGDEQRIAAEPVAVKALLAVKVPFLEKLVGHGIMMDRQEEVRRQIVGGSDAPDEAGPGIAFGH